MHIGVVAVAQERLGVAPGQRGVQVRDDQDLVIPADHRQDRAGPRISERGIDIRGTLGRRGADLARGRELDRDQAGNLGKPAHRLLVHRREGPGRGKRRRQHGNPVSPAGLGRADQFVRHAGYRTTRIAPAPK